MQLYNAGMVVNAEGGHRADLSIVHRAQPKVVATEVTDGALNPSWEALPRQSRAIMAQFADPQTPAEEFPQVFQTVLDHHGGNLNAFARSMHFSSGTVWKTARRLGIRTRTLSEALQARWDDPIEAERLRSSLLAGQRKIGNERTVKSSSAVIAPEVVVVEDVFRKDTLAQKGHMHSFLEEHVVDTQAQEGSALDEMEVGTEAIVGEESSESVDEIQPTAALQSPVDIFIDTQIRFKKIERPEQVMDVFTEEDFRNVGVIAVLERLRQLNSTSA